MAKPTPRVPSAWKASDVLREAVAVLDANPDLLGDDIAIALGSEAPSAIEMLNALVAVIKDREGSATVKAERIKEIHVRIKRDETVVERLRDLLASCMETLSLTSYSAPDGDISLAPHVGRVVIVDADAIPAEFKATKTETSIDKRAIAREFAAGRLVTGATQANSYKSVTIR